MKSVYKRLISIFLLLCMVVTAFPAALAANDTSNTETTTTTTSSENRSDLGNLFLCARPTLGSGVKQGWQYASFFTWIMRTTGSEQIIPAESAKDIEVYAFCRTDKGAMSRDYEVRLKYHTDKNVLSSMDPVAKSDGEVKTNITINQNMQNSIVYYLQAQLVDKTTHKILDTKTMNVTVQITHKKQNSIGYHRVGMQVYSIDGVPFGPYDYTASQETRVTNTKGIMTGGGTALYDAMDGGRYSNCYFDIEYADEGLQAGYGVTSKSLANAYEFIAKNYMSSSKAKIDKNLGAIKLEGPAYVECQGLGSTKRYNMAYYKPSQTTGINEYADWAWQSKADDFISYRKQSILIPLKLSGGITVKYFDEDTGATIHADTTIATDEFKNFDDSQDAFIEFVKNVAAAYSPAYASALENCGVPLNTNNNLINNFAAYKKAAASWVLNQETKQLSVKSDSQAEKMHEVIKQRENMITGEGTGLLKNPATSPYFAGKKVAPIAINGYMFDFGFGYDALSALNYGSALFVVGDEYKSSTIVVNSKTRSATVNLYYKAYGATKYSVKLRVNGTIDEKYTKTYPGVIDQVIKESDVDKSIVPPDFVINRVENTPLTLVKDPTKNIIIIDVTAPMGAYKVEYYLNGKLKESESHEARIGTVISSPPKKSYPGYTLSEIKGAPLTIVDRKGVIRVYYIKIVEITSNSSNVKLFKDAYKTEISTSKSGYGVYGLFYLNVAPYVNSSSYRNVRVQSATATWREGLPLTKANKNGKTVTKNLVRNAKSTSTVWAYAFPQNTGSNQKLAKAYIPINWANKTYWTVSCKAVVTFEHYHGKRIGWVHESTTFTGSRSIYVNGNMYQDDFTGSGKRR